MVSATDCFLIILAIAPIRCMILKGWFLVFLPLVNVLYRCRLTWVFYRVAEQWLGQQNGVSVRRIILMLMQLLRWLLHLFQIRCALNCLACLHLGQFGRICWCDLLHILAALMLLLLAALLWRSCRAVLLQGCSRSTNCLFDHFGASLLLMMELFTAGDVDWDDSAEVGLYVCPHACIFFVKGLN